MAGSVWELSPSAVEVQPSLNEAARVLVTSGLCRSDMMQSPGTCQAALPPPAQGAGRVLGTAHSACFSCLQRHH